MKIYLVGGAVRDKLLGLCPKDMDYVVIGSDPQEMLQRGFLPVGKSYSVYLHPQTREEFTLAASLIEDLLRRDLTINAMALDGDELFDPFGGKKDLENKTLRHIREENFFFDPLRVYRVARFCAQLPDFRVHPLTLSLLKTVVRTNEFKDLSRERIFEELKKSLFSPRPSHFFHLLKDIEGLDIHFNELQQLDTAEFNHTMKLLNATRNLESDSMLTFLSLGIHLNKKHASSLVNRILGPFDWSRGLKLIASFYRLSTQASELPKSHLVDILYGVDAFRQEKYLFLLCKLLSLDGHAKEQKILLNAFNCTKTISITDVSAHLEGKPLGEAIKRERVKRLECT